MASDNFYWNLDDNCLEISLTERTLTPGMADMQRGIPESLTASADINDNINDAETEQRPAKRLKPTITCPPRRWGSATRARIWISKEFLLELGGSNSHRHADNVAFLERSMKAIWEHAPNVTHCTLFSVPHAQSTVEHDGNGLPVCHYFPMNVLNMFLRNITQLTVLDVIGIGCFHHSDEELRSFRETLSGHFLQELSMVIDIDTPAFNYPIVLEKQAAWVNSMLALQNLRQLRMEGIPYLLSIPGCLQNLEGNSLSFMRLDVLFEPNMVKAVVDLIASCPNLNHLSLGLAVKGPRDVEDDFVVMKQLSTVIARSQFDILRIRMDKQLLEDLQLQRCWTDMLKRNYYTTRFEISTFTEYKGRVPEQEADVKIPAKFNMDVDAFIKMNAMARKRIFCPYLELESITNEGWARSMQEIGSSGLAPELAITCMYLYMRQRPAEISNQLLKQYAINSDTEEEQSENPLVSITAKIGKEKLKVLRKSERRFYDLAYELVSLRERLANFQRMIIDTSDKRMKTLAVVARIKQVSSGPGARDLSTTLAQVYEKATQLVACLEHHNGTIGESLGAFRTGGGLKSLTSELGQLKELIQTSFTMLEQMGVTP